MENEIWKPVVGYEKFYEVSNTGVVRNMSNKNVLKQYPCTKAPYRQVKLCYIGKPKSKLVHRLVWMAFNGFIESHIELNHINGDKIDNRLENLELSSRNHNLQHAYRHGLEFQKLTPGNVREIREKLATGLSRSELAREYKVSPHMIYMIHTRRRWSWLE